MGIRQRWKARAIEEVATLIRKTDIDQRAHATLFCARADTKLCHDRDSKPVSDDKIDLIDDL